MKAIRIFKAGKHTSMEGVEKNYTREMLADCVAAYSPNAHEAPFVLGHPKHNDPAMGWVSHLELDDDGYLLAHPKQVDPTFAEGVNAGKHNKVSASFYLPDSPNNPTPGKLSLRHVGFLGAQVPSVKGLGSVEFAEDEQGVVCFGDFGYELAADLFRKWRDYLIDELGQEKADLIAPNWMIESLREYANAKPQEVSASFAEHYASDANPASPTNPPSHDPIKDTPPPQKSPRELELEQQLADAQATLTAQETAKKEASFAEFVDGLVSAGHMPPKLKANAMSLLKAAGENDGVVSFAEGELNFAEAVKQFISQTFSGKSISFAERTPKHNVDPKVNTQENPLLTDAKKRASAG